MISNINYNVAGLRYPQIMIPVLTQPALAFENTQKAIGSFNSAQFQSAITPTQYCKLSAGGTHQGFNVGASQEYSWSLGTAANKQAQFIFGENLEVCAN